MKWFWAGASVQSGGCWHTRWPAYWNRLLGRVRAARRGKFPWPSGAQPKAEKTGAEKGTDTFSCFLCCQHPPKVIFFWRQKEEFNAWNKATLVLLDGRQVQTLLPDSLAEAGASASHGSRMLWGPEEEGTFPQMTLPTQSCKILYPFVWMYWNQIQLLTAGKTYTQEMSVGGKGKVASFRRPATWEDGRYVLRPSPRYWLGDKGYFGCLFSCAGSSLWYGGLAAPRDTGSLFPDQGWNAHPPH